MSDEFKENLNDVEIHCKNKTCDIHNSLEKMTLFSIGETTSKEIKKYTGHPIITSKENTLESVLKLIQREI